MQAQLKVVKADGSIEEYLHTKVIGTINNALAGAGQADVEVAQQLAEVVTYYLYNRQYHHTVPSSEIFSVIKAVLSATNYEEAAVALTEHHLQRKLKRSRIEVVRIDVGELEEAEQLAYITNCDDRYRWEKSKIVEDLVNEHNICRQAARMIASMVEEKIFNLGITLVPSSLIKQLVIGDAVMVLRAQQQLQTA